VNSVDWSLRLGPMLLQASREGNLDVVLRLLYTNPFLNKQELRDALWESVRCKQLAVLRSLLEFRVDPASSPSPAISQPPLSLRHVSWTPLLALAVNGSQERADLVAELLSRSDGQALRCSTKPITPNPPRSGTHRKEGASSSAGSAPPSKADLTPMLVVDGDESAKTIGCFPLDDATTRRHAALAKPAAHIAGCPSHKQSREMLVSGIASESQSSARPACDQEECSRSVGSSAVPSAHSTTTPQPHTVLQLLRGVFGAAGSSDREASLTQLRMDQLGVLEQELDTLLRNVRSHHQQRMLQQLQSVQRRHAEECKGRQSLEEEQACIVCSELEKTMLFLPCRHLCTCEACASQLHQCPICRAEIDSKVHAYRS